MGKQLIVIGGPTASGKTTLAIETAKRLNTEIISADSRQFFREMSIGTAKPTPQELAQVPHHFINSHSITEEFSAGDFEKAALEKIAQLHTTNDSVVLVGGSGLYIKAVCEGFDTFPEIPSEIRNTLNDRLVKEGLPALFKQLTLVDPSYAKTIDEHNPQRVLRALEVSIATNKPFSSFLGQGKSKRPFEIKTYVIDWPRAEIYDRINKRVEVMFQNGLLEEAKSLFPDRELNALQTVGYQELFSYFKKEIDLEEAKRLIKQNSRRYAKRQLTWFRKNPAVIWLKPGDSIDF